MTPEQSEEAHKNILAIATTAAQLASTVALLMHRRKLLHPAEAEHLAMLSRHLGELFQDFGEDELASDFGAHAAILREPPAA